MRCIYTEDYQRLYFPHQSITEKEYEAQLLHCLHHLFPGYKAAPWKPIIRDIYGRAAKPDLIMISLEYQGWYIVEVELSHHDVPRHIIPQLETLNLGIYDSSLLPSITHALPKLDRERLKRLIYRPPGRLCIVDSYTDRIHSACRDHDFDLAVLEPFLAKDGRVALSVQKAPSALVDSTSVGVYQLSLVGRIGDKFVLALPRHFPAWRGEITVVDLSGTHRMCKIYHTGTNRTLIVDGALVPSGKAIRLVTLDASSQVLRLEIH